mgnify:CR=1 FL=1
MIDFMKAKINVINVKFRLTFQLGAVLLANLKKMAKKTKKIKIVNYLNKQTAYQIGSMWRACGYKVVYVF